MPDKKLLLGPKVRRLRKDQRLTQAQMAADLDISPAYLNLIEHNQRPVSAQVLVKIAASYDIDLPSFAKDETPEMAAKFREVFAGQESRLAPQDLQDMAALSPEARDLILALAEARKSAPTLTSLEVPLDPSALTVRQEAQAYFDGISPYFAELEDQAHELRHQMSLRAQEVAEALDKALETICPFTIQVLPARIMGTTLRRYDLHGRRLLLNRLLPSGSKRFQILIQYVLNQQGPALDLHLRARAWHHAEAKSAVRIHLAAYVAAAVLMPYSLYAQTADASGYDLETLAHEFDVTREQAAHRLASLRKMGETAPAFFMARYDSAGRQTKALGFHAMPPGLRQHPALKELAGEVQRARGLRCTQVTLEGEETAELIGFARQKPGLGFHAPGPVSSIILGHILQEGVRTVYSQPIDGRVGLGVSVRPSWHTEPMAPAPEDMGLDEHRRDMRPYAFR